MRNNKRALYESIMKQVASVVYRAVNEMDMQSNAYSEKYVPKTKEDLIEWAEQISADGCGCYVVVNGGGLSFIESDSIVSFFSDIANDDVYSDNIEIIEKGNEYSDFKSSLNTDEYEGTECFLMIPHLNGYNSDNMDIQVQYWAY